MFASVKKYESYILSIHEYIEPGWHFKTERFIWNTFCFQCEQRWQLLGPLPVPVTCLQRVVIFSFLFGSIFSVILSVKNNGYFKRFFLHHDLIYILSVNKWIIPYINCWFYYCYLWWHSSLIKWMEYMYLLKVLMELKNPNNGSLIIWYTI